MRHHNTTKKFGREKNQRLALERSLVRALILEEKITTTESKAKALRPIAEKLITKAKNADLSDVRHITSTLGNQKDVAAKLVKDVAPRYSERAGGYTRITKLGRRKGDAAPMAVIELV